MLTDNSAYRFTQLQIMQDDEYLYIFVVFYVHFFHFAFLPSATEEI